MFQWRWFSVSNEDNSDMDIDSSKSEHHSHDLKTMEIDERMNMQ